MAKIIPKLNLNKTPQSAENHSLIFAKDIILNKDNTISRDEVLYKVLDSSNLSGYKIAGFISYNNEFYIFLFKKTGDVITASKIVKYVENSDNTFTTSNVPCNWNYSGGEIDGLVIKSLNGDTLLIINEYNAPKDVPLKTINLNTCTVVDNESIYSQLPNIPIINLINTGTYSQKIPKGVYQFFIRYEIAKDFYTNWMPCSKELYAYNTTYKQIVQGTIKYSDDKSDSDFSFVLTPRNISNSTYSYSRFQLGFVLSNNDSVVCRTWKHFDISTINTPIYFSYEQTDIEEYDIDEMMKPLFELYNVKNVTTFKNKIYVSNYKETNFNPIFTNNNNGNVTYQTKQIAAHYEALTNPTIHITGVTPTEGYPLRRSEGLPSGGFNKIGNAFVSAQFGIEIGEIYGEGNGFISVASDVLLPNGDPFDSTGYDNYPTIPYTNYEDALGYAPTKDYIEIAYTTEGGTSYVFIDKYYTPQGYVSFDFEDADNEPYDGLNVINGKIQALLGNYEFLCITPDKQIKFIDSTGVHDIQYIRYYGVSREDTITEFGERYAYFFRVDLQLYVDSDVTINYQRYVSEYKGQTLMPRTGYKFYVHYVKQNGEITNGYPVTNTGNDVTDWFNKDTYVCVPKFTNINIPSGYVAAFITYAKVKNKYVDVINTGVSMTGTDGLTYYLYDCIEIDSNISPKWDKISIRNGSDNLVKDSNAFYRPSSFYDDTLPKVFGSTGKLISKVNITNPYILDEFEISKDKIELVRCTPYFTDSYFEDYEYLNLRGFISKVYKPENVSSKLDINNEFIDPTDATKVLDEYTYYYTGTDIYTKNENGDLNQYKGKKDLGSSSYTTVLSEYNLEALTLANQFVDITRPYYVVNMNNGENNEGTVNTTQDASYEYYKNKTIKSTDNTWLNKCILIPFYKVQDKDVGLIKKLKTGSVSNLIRFNSGAKYISYIPVDSNGHYTLVNDICTIDINSVSNVPVDVSVDGFEILGNSNMTFDYVDYSTISSNVETVTKDDVGHYITRVHQYTTENTLNQCEVEKYILTTASKVTVRYAKYVTETSIKKTQTWGWARDNMISDSYGGVVPDPNQEAQIWAYHLDIGFVRETDKTYQSSTSYEQNSSENTAELTAYQQFSYIESLNLSTLYKLPSEFINVQRPTYSIFNYEDNIVEFNNTIRSSDILTDESKKYVFKFDATSYYNVDCSKGKIVNLVTVGNYIIVHTEDSIFTFSGSNSLQTANGEAKLSESNVFDTGVTEVVGSKYGYCGLKQKNHACVTQSGYIFYDAPVNKIYAYTGQGSVNSISDNIDKLMKLGRIIDVNFGNDYYNDRLLICIKYNINSSTKFATLSFNYRLNSFVSAHNFWFDKSFNTKTNAYYASRDGAISGEFGAISFSDKKTQSWTGLLNDFYNSENITDIFPRLTIDNNLSSVIDVIYNENYELIKTLNSVNWVCNSIYSFDEDNTLMAEEKYEKSDNIVNYPGDKIKIYTDTCRTEDIQVYSQTVNNSYEKPRYNNGIWSFNYFRNISTGSTNNSDDKSLIYGKYIILRFIFDSYNHDFKLENVIFNISK